MTKITAFKGISVIVFIALISLDAKAEGQSTSTLQTPTPPSEKISTSNIKWKSDLRAKLVGSDVEDRFFKGSYVATDLVSSTNAKFNDWLNFDFKFEGFFTSANSKSFYTSEGKSSDGIYLAEAAMNVTPLQGLSLRGGALGTQTNPLLSLMDENVFMGVSEAYQFTVKDLGLTLTGSAEQAVPSAGSVTHGLIDDAPGAFFQTQSLMVEIKAESVKSELKLAVSHFEFGNLSSNIATDSKLIGNDPRSFEGLGANSRFKIGFSGFETAGEFETKWLSNFSTKLTGNLIRNIEGPSDRNSGTTWGVSASWKLNNIILNPTLVFFDVGGDVFPAVYTWFPRRVMNRQGYAAKMKLDLEKERVGFYAAYFRGDLILPNPYMADRDIYQIGVEAKYDIL